MIKLISLKETIIPAGLDFGVAIAGEQYEGGRESRGEGIWDRFGLTPGNIAHGDTMDIACDGYHRFNEDIQLMRSLGMKNFRLSMQWPRIFPEGTGAVNREGVQFYHRFIDALQHAGIEPSVTLYHWNLPQALHDRYGGWINRQSVYDYLHYANFIFKEFGNDVAVFYPFNEMKVIAHNGYGIGEFAPGVRDLQSAAAVIHHLMLAHGMAVDSYKSMYPHGTIGSTFAINSSYPARDDTPADQEAARLATLSDNNWYLDPIFKGQYPAELISGLGQYRGLDFGFNKPGDTAQMNSYGGGDILGVQYYSGAWIQASKDDNLYNYISNWADRPLGPKLPKSSVGWDIYPQGLYDILMWLKTNYDRPLWVTENGIALNDLISADGHVHDTLRIDYYRDHIQAVIRAIHDGADVRRYFAWSVFDNFEWAKGYAPRFGLAYVDYATQARILKDSAYFFSAIARDRRILEMYNPDYNLPI